jgi:hypothetical protein
MLLGILSELGKKAKSMTYGEISKSFQDILKINSSLEPLETLDIP